MCSFIRTSVSIRVRTGNNVRNARLVFSCLTSEFQLVDFYGTKIAFFLNAFFD
jgi:hypothetical protein